MNHLIDLEVDDRTILKCITKDGRAEAKLPESGWGQLSILLTQ
jgi:hypothetical protein